jgi:opacity protein-like surface antigen
LYRGGADGRLGFRLERIALFVEGGAGVALISSNILEKAMIVDPGEKYSIAFHAGGGVEYQLENRHYAVGLGVNAFLAPQFAPPSGAMKALDSRLYLRYTYGG